MLTVAQVSERLNVSAKIVYALIESGQLVSHRFGVGRGTIRVSEADLQAYITSCRLETDRAPQRRPRPRLKHINL